jgi:hypothetical protein
MDLLALLPFLVAGLLTGQLIKWLSGPPDDTHPAIHRPGPQAPPQAPLPSPFPPLPLPSQVYLESCKSELQQEVQALGGAPKGGPAASGQGSALTEAAFKLAMDRK